MPLQNRVLPNGDIVAQPWRGGMMGNRGGKLHDPERKMLHSTRRWASKQWICCRTEFNNRQRTVMGNSYTELFFMDEVSALAAGHRPCFECRRQAFHAYAEALRKQMGKKQRMTAGEMDTVLHGQRLSDRQKAVENVLFEELPSGATFFDADLFWMKFGDHILHWNEQGYRFADQKNADFTGRAVACLTPALNLDALRGGYQPQWHRSVEKLAL